MTSRQKDNLIIEPQLNQIAQIEGFESEGRMHANGLARTIKDGDGGGGGGGSGSKNRIGMILVPK